MVKMGKCSITPFHHILTEEGWMTAQQAAARGQGTVFRSRTERVYNFYLEGGGNIIINSSRQPGGTILTTAATMGYLFSPIPESRQIGFLTYPDDIRTQLGLRQDLSKGNARFRPGDVKTLSNGELVFKNITGNIPPTNPPGMGPKLSQALAPLPGNSPAAERLIPSEPNRAITFNEAHLQFGRKSFGDVQTLPKEELLLKDTMCDIPPKMKLSTGPVLPRLPAPSDARLDRELIKQRLIKSILHDNALPHQEKQRHVQAIWAGKADGFNISASLTNLRATVKSLALLEPPAATSRLKLVDGSEPNRGSQSERTAADVTGVQDPHLYQAMAQATWLKPS